MPSTRSQASFRPKRAVPPEDMPQKPQRPSEHSLVHWRLSARPSIFPYAALLVDASAACPLDNISHRLNSSCTAMVEMVSRSYDGVLYWAEQCETVDRHRHNALHRNWRPRNMEIYLSRLEGNPRMVGLSPHAWPGMNSIQTPLSATSPERGIYADGVAGSSSLPGGV